MSTSVRAGLATGEISRPSAAVWQPLVAILAVGFVLRLLFIGADGFHNDISAFESWSLTLAEKGPGLFYASTSFADYPPGYFYVLWLIGGIWELFGHAHDPSYSLLKVLVKMPAILADLGDSVLIFMLVRRYVTPKWATIAAAAFALNPAAIYVSAYWGQVDSVAAAASLGTLLLLALGGARSDRRGSVLITLAWLVFGAGILLKPQSALLAAVMFAFPFTASTLAERNRRLIATGYGIVASFALALAATLPFHPTANPLEAYQWLFQRYAFGSAVYKYTSVNAFNLYAVMKSFWSPDDVALSYNLFGLTIPLGPTYLWGIVLTLASAFLIAVRYASLKTERAMLEAGFLVCLGFFVLSTRMHERYIFGAFALVMPLLAFGRRYVYAAIAITITLFANLAYSLKYQTVMEQHTVGVDATNIWPAISHPASLINVVVFFALGYMYLGGRSLINESVLPSAEGFGQSRIARIARGWFNPVEGIVGFTRLDWLVGGGFTLLSFLICLYGYWWPNEKIFDEIYYARSGEEYLNGTDLNRMGVFEFTHPPFTKLLITFSMMLFGGLHSAHGDDAYGWRFLNVVVGAIMVALTYVFAKRITSSTLFASLAALMMTFDGFHFAQSRISTPEITVATLSLAVLYAFYRFWTASAVHVRERVPGRFGPLFWAVMGVGTVLAVGASYVGNHIGHEEWVDGVNGDKMEKYYVAFAYFEMLVYLAARTIVPRFLKSSARETTYADGTIVAKVGNNLTLHPPDAEAGILVMQNKKGEQLVAERTDDGVATARYERDGTMTYASPDGTATYRLDGTATGAGTTIAKGEAGRWLIILAVLGGLLGASKWNGLFDFFVVWGILVLVLGQRYLRKPALFGNPNGIPVDIVACTMLAVSGAIYLLAYIPFFLQRHDFNDLLGLQWQMYHYHSTLVATHPYSSVWWQWPILQKPISYYYHDFRTGVDASREAACCVSEILALPNPLVWWSGLVTVPLVAWLAYTERNRAFALVVIAYVIQWLPWIASPRLSFEYHFFPNLVLIILANTIVLQRIWVLGEGGRSAWLADKLFGIPASRYIIGVYAVATVALFIFFYPVVSGQHVPWDVWHARMWQSSWII